MMGMYTEHSEFFEHDISESCTFLSSRVWEKNSCKEHHQICSTSLQAGWLVN